MLANERSHDDQPGTTVRGRRRRLLVHAGVFAAAGVACLTLGTSSTGAAPTVQDGRFLQGGDIDVVYTCTGADAATQTILNSILLSTFTIDANVRSAAVEPSPSPGEDFDMEFTWDFTLPTNLVQTAVDLEQATLTISGDDRVSVVSGATGADAVGTGGPETLEMGDGTVPVGFTHGPFTATFNRTAAVDEPITFAPGQITNKTVTATGITLNIVCDPDGTTMVLNDETGVAPSTTSTTRPEVVATTAGPATTVAVGGTGSLPVTGSSSNLFLVLLALALIDVGYLALTASKSPRHRRA